MRMLSAFGVLALGLTAGPALFAADAVGEIFDGPISVVEGDVVRLAEKMPADKYDFAPTNGTFSGVRTFGMQVKHIATTLYAVSASVLEEKPPVAVDPDLNGSDSLRTKEQIVAYLKDSIAYAHKAMQSVTKDNMLDKVPSPFGQGTMGRAEAASFLGWHSFDHYGQMVVYARMNNVVPGS